MDTKARVRDAQTKIIDRLAESESAVGDLYKAYRDLDPEMAPFWQALVQEEEMHARLLTSMHTFLEKGNIFFNLGRFDLDSLETFLAFVAKERAAAEERVLSRSQMVGVALNVETSIQDSGFYDLVKSDAPAFRHIAEKLSTDTKVHVQKIRDLFLASGARPVASP